MVAAIIPANIQIENGCQAMPDSLLVLEPHKTPHGAGTLSIDELYMQHFTRYISEDKAPVCAFGKLLLNVCQGSDIATLNGRSPGKNSGCFTCHTSNGKSVADYFLASSQLVPAVLRNLVY